MRKILVAALVLLAAGCSRSTDELVGKLKAKDTADRLHAIEALSHRPGEADRIVPALSEALKDTDPFIRRNAAQGLARLGPGARPASPALRLLLKDRNKQVRKAAEQALQSIDADGNG
jgi:HEAT repeat protein